MAKLSQDSNLDILRSIAVLAVFMTHTLQVMAGCKFGEHFAFGIETYSLGRVGVLLFFVHTSLVLMQSLERAAMGLSDWSLLMAHFYIRRLFRVYPLSVSLVLLSIVFSIPPNALVPYEWQGVRWAVANILLIQNVVVGTSISAPMWSLPYEIQMYLVLPVLFLAVRTRRCGLRLALIIMGSMILGGFHPLFRYFPCFLAGVMAYKLLKAVRPRLPARLWTPALIAVAVSYIVAAHSDKSWSKDVLTCLAVATLIPLFHRNTGTIARIASQMAKYSYGIYLCHTPLIWLLYGKLAIPDWQRPIWLVVATGLTSVTCYHAIEHPLIIIGTRLANKVSVNFNEPAAAAVA